MSAYPPVNTQVIGKAESALGAILDPILTKTRTSFPQWLVLTVLAGNGGDSELGRLVAQIASARKVEDEVVLAAVHELTADGLVKESGGIIAMTESGRARQGQVRGRIAEITGRLFDDFAPKDLEAAGRVLTIITERANAELARMAS